MSDSKQKWEEYCDQELGRLNRVLNGLGYTLNTTQVHIGGERYLMAGAQDIGGGGYKLVLTGNRVSDNAKVIIKASSDPRGVSEITLERTNRETISKINFAYNTLYTPQELLFTKIKGLVIFITQYIPEDHPLLSRNSREQFTLLLNALKMQEGVHATTYAHAKSVKKLGVANTETYIKSMRSFITDIRNADPKNTGLHSTIDNAFQFFTKHQDIVTQYCGFLTHADFVPHNLRIDGEKVYLIDFASVHFGNKHESWARLINYMVIYNPELEQAFLTYVSQNRSTQESLSLRLMRIYKLVFLLRYHTTSLPKTSGNLKLLTKVRIQFWSKVLVFVLKNKQIPLALRVEYRLQRDSLRSNSEKERQRELHQLL